jgi:hypothetical protein
VAQAQKKKRGGRDKTFGPYELVKYVPEHQAVTLQQIVAKVEAAFRAKGVKPPSQRTIQRTLQVAAGEVKDNGQLINLVEHKGRGYIRSENRALSALQESLRPWIILSTIQVASASRACRHRARTVKKAVKAAASTCGRTVTEYLLECHRMVADKLPKG